MRGGIDERFNIELYLEHWEVINLKYEELKGFLIKTHKPKRQGIITLSVDYENIMRGSEIKTNSDEYFGVKDNFFLRAFMKPEWYEEFVENGGIGLRSDMFNGSTFEIHDTSRGDGMVAFGAQNLKYYRDNRSELSEKEFE